MCVHIERSRRERMMLERTDRDRMKEELAFARSTDNSPIEQREGIIYEHRCRKVGA